MGRALRPAPEPTMPRTPYHDPSAPRPDEVTPEAVYRARRRLMGAGLAAPLALVAGCGDAEPPPAPVLPPMPPDPRGFTTTEAQSSFEQASGYNNFYEFGTSKADPARYAHTLRTSPWSVRVGGEAEVTGEVALADLLAGIEVHERIYRLRCVEGWSMVIPWRGVQLGDVLARFRPTAKAKYVAFETLADPETMPGVRWPSIDWPYREGLRMDEAMHPLALLATGMYGRDLPPQNGAPLRLVVPWKYGFKSIKSIVAITFTETMPPTSWNELQPSEYGFFANVNPAVDHPRWSQASERRIAGGANLLFAERIPTLPFNGYAEQVAAMYAGMDLARWY